MALAVKWKAPIVITSLGAREDVNAAVHGYGGVTLHDIINDRFARKAIEKGADGLIAVAAGAGGHAGSTLAVRAGAGDPRMVRRAARPVRRHRHRRRHPRRRRRWAPTSPISARPSSPRTEARAIDEYKQVIVEGRAEDIVCSSLFTGIFGNYLKPSIVKAGLDPDHLPAGEAKMLDLAAAGGPGVKVWRDIWGSGQGIGAVKAVTSAAELVERLAREYAVAKARVCAG